MADFTTPQSDLEAAPAQAPAPAGFTAPPQDSTGTFQAPSSDLMEDRVHDPKFDQVQYAALHPEALHDMYQVDQGKQALPFSEKVKNAFSDPIGTLTGAAKGFGNFLAGITYKNPVISAGEQAVDAATGDPDAKTHQAEAVITGQNDEVSADKLAAGLIDRPAAALVNATSDPDPSRTAWRASFARRFPDEAAKLKPEWDAQDTADKSAASDALNQRLFANKVDLARKSIQLQSGKPLNSGPIASFYNALGHDASDELSPEALKEAGAAPVNPATVAAQSAATDPSLPLLSVAPEIPGASYVGGKIAQGAGALAQLPMAALEKAPGALGKAATGMSTGAGVALGETAMHNPLLAAKIGVGVAAAKGLQKLGQVVEQQGAETATGIPSQLSQDSAAGRLAAARGMGGINFGAEAGRVIGNIPAKALSTMTGMAPLNAATSDSPKDFVQNEVGAGVFGAGLDGLSSARPALVEALRPTMRDEGIKSMDASDTPLANASTAYINSMPEDARNTVLETMGMLQGLNTKDSSGNKGYSRFYVVDAPTYKAELQKQTGNVPDDGGRGFFIDSNGHAVINGDAQGSTGDLAHTMGHEGGHMAATILQAAGSPGSTVWDNMMSSVSKSLMPGGKPTQQFQNFIDTYNKAFDPTGKYQHLDPSDPHSIEEFLAEHAGRIIAGEGPASVALPKTIYDKIQEGVGNFAGKALGIQPTIGQTSPLNAEESAKATALMRESLQQIAQSPRDTPPAGVKPAPAQAPDPTAAASGAPQASSAPISGTPQPTAAEAQSRADVEAALKALGHNATTARQLAATAKGNDTSEMLRDALQQTQRGKAVMKPVTPPAPVEPTPAEPEAATPALSELTPSSNETVTQQDASGGGTAVAQEQRVDSPSQPGTQEVPPVSHEQIATALSGADAAAELRGARARGGANKTKEQRQAEIQKEERVNALTNLLPKDGTGLHQATDPDTGDASIRGDIDPANPLHAAIAKEHNQTPEQIANIVNLQNQKGNGVWLRQYQHAAQGENYDDSAAQRNVEYSASPTSGEQGKREGQVTEADKPFTPYTTVLTSKGFNVRGFDHDKFLQNVDKVADNAQSAGQPTGLEGIKGQDRDKAVSEAFRTIAENHANGWKGDGSAPLKTFPDSGIKQNLDYVGKPVNTDLANVINMAMNYRGALTPVEPTGRGEKGPTEGALSRFAKASSKAKEAQGLSQMNDGFLNAATGETNPLRDNLESKGFDTQRELKPTSSNIRPDLIKGGIDSQPDTARTIHPHGFDIPPADLTTAGTPREKPTIAGFMPGQGEASSIQSKKDEPALSKFMPNAERDDSIYRQPGKTIDVSEDANKLPKGWTLQQDGGLWIAKDSDGKRVAATGSRDGTLQTALKAANEQSIDPRTGSRTLIPSGRLTAEQSEAASSALRAHYHNYNAALSEAVASDTDESFNKVANALPKTSLDKIGIKLDPTTTGPGFSITDPHDSLRYAGRGGESVTFLDGDVAYKLFYPQFNFETDSPDGIGIQGDISKKANGEWDTKFTSGTPGSMLEKLHVISRAGGIPSELLGVTDGGGMIVKQPKYNDTPRADISTKDNFNQSYKCGQIDSWHPKTDAESKIVSSGALGRIAVVDGVPFSVKDLTGSNHTVDNAGNFRVADAVTARIPRELIDEVPSLKAKIEELTQNENKSRSKVAFMPNGDAKENNEELPDDSKPGDRIPLRGQNGDTPEDSQKPGGPGATPGNSEAGAEGKKISFTHWSSTPGLETLDPSFHGKGAPGAESKRQQAYPDRYIPRSYVGLDGYEKETALGPHQSKGTIDPSLLYDYAKDPLNLIPLAKQGMKEGDAPGYDQARFKTEMERQIRDHGYLGYKSGNVAALFHSVPANGHIGADEFMKSAPDYARRSPEMMRTLREDVPNFDSIEEGYFGQKPANPQQVSRQNEIANDYEKAKSDNLSDPNVQRAYKALSDKVSDQFDQVLKGVNVEPWADKQPDGTWKPREGEPYKSSGEMQKDLKDNKHLYFLSTDKDTFGSSGNHSDNNPMLQDSGKKTENGYPLLNNDMFRAVHDAIAHGSFGTQFGPAGEEAAWKAHMATISDPWARWALTTETRGQSSWVNFRNEYLNEDGSPKKKGDAGYVPVTERPFADQKADLLPAKHMLTGDRAVDEPVTNNPEFREAAGLPSVIRDGEGKFMPTSGEQDDQNAPALSKFMPKTPGKNERDPALQDLNLGPRFTPEALSQQAVKRRVSTTGDKFPEAIQPTYKKDENGKFALDEDGRPTADKIDYNLDQTPLAKNAMKGIRGDDKRAEAVKSAFADKLVSEYDKVQSNPKIMAGKDWYDVARSRIQDHFGKDSLLFAQLLGATSARTPARENYGQALEAYNLSKDGKYDGYAKKYLDLENKLENGTPMQFTETYSKKVGGKTTTFDAGTPVTPTNFKFFLDQQGVLPKKENGKEFNANSLQVLRVIAGNWESKVGGPKTPNFARNLSGEGQNPFEATIDVWAARHLHRIANDGLTDKRWRILPESEPGVSDADFHLGQAAYKAVADKIGIKPDSLQAVLWFAEKNHWEQKGWTRGTGAELSDFSSLLAKTVNKDGKKVLEKALDPQMNLWF